MDGGVQQVKVKEVKFYLVPLHLSSSVVDIVWAVAALERIISNTGDSGQVGAVLKRIPSNAGNTVVDYDCLDLITQSPQGLLLEEVGSVAGANRES